MVVLAWELDNRTLITGFHQALEFGAISNTCQTMVCRGVVQVSVNAHIPLCTCKTMVFINKKNLINHFDWSFTKKISPIFNLLQKEPFSIEKHSPLAYLLIIQAHFFWAKNVRLTLVLVGNILHAYSLVHVISPPLFE